MSAHLGACRLSEIKAKSHLVVGDRTLWRSFDADPIKILMQLGGRSRFEQKQVAVDLGPGAAVIFDPMRSYSLLNLSDLDQLVLQVPRSTFSDETLGRLSAPVPLSGDDDSLTHVVSGLMQMAISTAHKLDAVGCRRIGESLMQLVNGLIQASPVPPNFRRSPLEALRERIVAYIDANLTRPGLSAGDIARNMGCSRRYLHRAFEGEDATLERFVWNRRLERSKEELLSPARASDSISEIAFACGFNSSAHFSRAFKSRYDLAPSELRQSMRAMAHYGHSATDE